jgi:regulator of RNase E activity RraA
MEDSGKVINRPEKTIIEGLRQLGTCAISDAFDKLGIKSVITGINPLFSGAKIVGPVVTITQAVATHTYTGMALSKTKFVIENVAQIGDVIFISAPGCKDFATWGEMVSIRCKVKGIEGVVIDGATRDIDKIRQLRFPVFTKAFTPVCEFSRIQTISINEHIQCNGVQIIPGDNTCRR